MSTRSPRLPRTRLGRSTSNIGDEEDRTYVFAYTRFTEELEELELAEGPETKHGVVEGRDLLDGDLAATWSVDCRTYDPVRALSYDVQDLVLGTCARVLAAAVRASDKWYAPTLKRTFRGAG